MKTRKKVEKTKKFPLFLILKFVILRYFNFYCNKVGNNRGDLILGISGHGFILLTNRSGHL